MRASTELPKAFGDYEMKDRAMAIFFVVLIHQVMPSVAEAEYIFTQGEEFTFEFSELELVGTGSKSVFVAINMGCGGCWFRCGSGKPPMVHTYSYGGCRTPKR